MGKLTPELREVAREMLPTSASVSFDGRGDIELSWASGDQDGVLFARHEPIDETRLREALAPLIKWRMLRAAKLARKAG